MGKLHTVTEQMGNALENLPPVGITPDGRCVRNLTADRVQLASAIGGSAS
jgi:hypothetical protein